MGEIVHSDYIGSNALENITSIVKVDNNKIYISAKDSITVLSSYLLEQSGKINYDPTYHNLIGKKIKFISSYKNYLIIIPNDEFKIILVDRENMGKIELKVFNEKSNTNEEIYEYIIDTILRVPFIKKQELINFDLTACVIIEKKVYFFIQLINCKYNKLFIIEGVLNEKSLSLKISFELQTFFNLYKSGRRFNLSKYDSKTVICNGVTYNTEKNIFILLMIYGKDYNNGYITTISWFDKLNGMSTALLHINTFKIENKPRGITYLNDDKYLIITNHTKCKNENNKLIKYYLIKLI